MTNYNEQELLRKYREGKCSEAELGWIEAWYGDWNMKDRVLLSESDLDHAEKLMRENILKRTSDRTIKLWPRIAVAASIILMVSIGLWFSREVILNLFQAPTAGRYANDIAPGKNTATLTLADGKTITLSGTKSGLVIADRKLTYKDGSTVDGGHPELVSGSRGSYTTMLTASTPRGGTYQVILADGTRVWLNAASKLSFPSQFSGRNRTVVLDGEAYFEVAKNKKMPFIVVSGKQEVLVLGTHFNVMAYADENVMKTALLEGSVSVSGTGGRKTLIPGWEAVNTGTNIEIYKVETEAAIAWKNGEFIFENESLRSIMQKIARWYDVEVVYGQGVNTAETFGGKVARNKHISAVLSSMQSTGKIKFEIDGKKVIVTK